RRGRLRRHPAVGARREPVVLRDRGGQGRSRGVQGQTATRFRPVPPAGLTSEGTTDMTDVVSRRTAGPGIMGVTMTRPPANAPGPPILDGLHAAVDAAEAAGDVRVMVLGSTVDGFFAAGADIKHMSTVDGPSFAAYGDRMRAVNDRIAAAGFLSVAAIDG